MKGFQPQNDHVAKSLEKQMEAERGRRENELNTQVVRTSEGVRDSEKLKADAIYYAAQKVSDLIATRWSSPQRRRLTRFRK